MMINDEILMLMLEDFIEVGRVTDEEVYPVYPMETAEDLVKDSLGRLGYNMDFNFEDDWFVKEGNVLYSKTTEQVKSILADDKDNIVSLYDKLEEGEYSSDIMNETEIRTELLKQAVVEDEVDEEDSVLYQDVNLSAIAEVVSEVSVKLVRAHLVSITTPSWDVVKDDDVYYLIEN